MVGKTAVEEVTVAGADNDMRLDRWFKNHYPQLSHGNLQKMMRKGQVRIDGAKVKEAKARVFLVT